MHPYYWTRNEMSSLFAPSMLTLFCFQLWETHHRRLAPKASEDSEAASIMALYADFRRADKPAPRATSWVYQSSDISLKRAMESRSQPQRDVP